MISLLRFTGGNKYYTYKVATVANSTSTMHKIASKPFELQDFSYDHMNEKALASLKATIDVLEELRQEYLETKDKRIPKFHDSAIA